MKSAQKIVRISVNDAIEALSALERLSDVANRVHELVVKCLELSSRVVASLDIDTETAISVDVKYRVEFSCLDPSMISVRELETPGKYTLVGGVLEPSHKTEVLSTIYLKHLTLQDIVSLAVHEKLENLVTRLVEEAYRVDENVGKKVEALRNIINAVKNFVKLSA